MDVLEDYMHSRFENFMLPYLRKLFPEDCRTLEDRRLRRLVRRGIEEANSYGIETYSEIAKYISLYFALSFNFVEDDRYPWARRELMRTDISEAQKLRCLMQKTRKVLEHSAEEVCVG